MSAALLDRARASVERARALQVRAAALAAALEAGKDSLDRGLDRARALRPEGAPFRVTGTIAGRTCSAEWRDGVLFGDTAAVERARLVVALHRSLEPAPRPSLRGSQAQALLAVLRGFDRVESVVIETGEEDGPAPGAQ